MLEILPPSTEPWRFVIVRRHKPPATNDFRSFRDCLRWEFGFSCAFCLLHESDLSENGTEGWGLMWIEHAELQSRRPDLANQYTNCFYSCRFCNQARGTKPSLIDYQVLLLNPCMVPWEFHFKRVDDELQVRYEDRNAAYTLEAYDLNEPRKVRMRKKRRTALHERLDLVTQSRPLHNRLLERAQETGDPTLVDDAKDAWDFFCLAYEDLKSFGGIPEDVSDRCACEHSQHHSLPEVLAEQMIRL